MWQGKITDELKELFRQYHEKFGIGYPDEYDELCYEAMSYEQFVGFIREALEKNKELPEIVP